jgi:hexosaminidase
MLAMLLAVSAITPRYAIVPEPKVMIPQPDTFGFSPEVPLIADGKLSKVAEHFNQQFAKATGFRLGATKPTDAKTGAKHAVRMKLSKDVAKLGAEGYRLEINQNEVLITASAPAGAFYATQSLMQLLPIKNKDVDYQKWTWEVPGVIIEDSPRFSWRGSHLDVGRHFMPLDWIKKYIDLLAFHKINTFHWHLTEDQGWRIEIKKYPKLTQVGSQRTATMLKYSPKEMENKPYGGFYTQAEAKEIVKYAADRFITVVPEIEMPGHAQAAIAAYPELGNDGKQIGVATTWGVITHVFNPEESTIKFLQDVLDEILAIFPSKYIGGDECPKDEWKASPRVQELMKQRGLKDEHEMQSWFVRQMDTYLEKKGRHLIGWDEILEGGLAPGAAVMSWRGEAGGIEAAKQGHKVVMASTNALYFDYYQGDKQTEPHAIGGYLPLRSVYEFDILPKDLNPDQEKYILGGQFQLWTEYIRTPQYAEYMAFPRGCAASEIFWSPKSKRNYRDFLSRMTSHVVRLQQMGVNVRPLDADNGEPTAQWREGEVSNDYQTKEWDITAGFRGDGTYQVKFLYTSGGHRLDVNGIEIVVNGKVISSDNHYGRTGNAHLNNIWKVKLSGVPSGSKVILRAQARGDGGGDTNGEITFWRI